MAAADLAAIKSRLSNPNVYWKHEAIYGAGEAVSPTEYVGSGDVQEFRYARDLKRVFNGENLAYLKNFGEAWGHLPSDEAAVFVTNHDTERNGETLTYKDGATYTLAHVFMLAWPYGSPDVHSGYEFTDHDAGPPNGGQVNACYSDGWKCQHAWREISSMVGFRNTARGQGVTDWWDNGGDQIAFGRGSKAYVAINHEGTSLTRTFQTSLPAGTTATSRRARVSRSTGQAGSPPPWAPARPWPCTSAPAPVTAAIPATPTRCPPACPSRSTPPPAGARTST